MMYKDVVTIVSSVGLAILALVAGTSPLWIMYLLGWWADRRRRGHASCCTNPDCGTDDVPRASAPVQRVEVYVPPPSCDLDDLPW